MGLKEDYRLKKLKKEMHRLHCEITKCCDGEGGDGLTCEDLGACQEIIDIKESIPTNNSELVNDSGYITCADLENCQEIIDIKDSIPTDVSDLTDNEELLFSGDYNDLDNKPTIPTNNSELGNDSGYITCEDLESCQEIIDIKDSIPTDVSDLTDTNGILSEYKGEHSSAPLSPQKGWFYKNTDNGVMYYFDGTNWVAYAEGGGGGDGLTLIEKTYLELTTMITNSELDPGQLYLMTDFQTIYDQPDYSDAYTPKVSVVTKTAVVNPIILLAISETEFAKEVWRPSTPKHTLEYDIHFVETEVMGATAKGRITYCKDEFDNETHYDHTVVRLKRYESVSGTGIFNSFWDTGFGSKEVLTFGANSLSNKIGDNYYKLAGGFAISNNVLGESAIGNIINSGSNNNTFGDDTQGNTFGGYTNNNTFGNNIGGNIFGDRARNNTFGNNIGNNTFGNRTENNTFRNNTDSNTFGNDTNNNTTLGNNTSSNTFGDFTQNNTFGDFTQGNTFGNGTDSNTFGDNTRENIFGNDTQGIDFTTTPTPTHIYANYPCNIFKRQDNTVRLSYYDNTDTLVVVDPTD